MSTEPPAGAWRRVGAQPTASHRSWYPTPECSLGGTCSKCSNRDSTSCWERPQYHPQDECALDGMFPQTPPALSTLMEVICMPTGTILIYSQGPSSLQSSFRCFQGDHRGNHTQTTGHPHSAPAGCVAASPPVPSPDFASQHGLQCSECLEGLKLHKCAHHQADDTGGVVKNPQNNGSQVSGEECFVMVFDPNSQINRNDRL